MLERLAKITYKIESNKVFSSIKRGLAALIPVLMTGCAAITLLNLPIPGYSEFIAGLLGGAVRSLLLFIYSASFDFISAYLVISISFFYSIELKSGDRDLQIMSVITAFACFTASFGAVLGEMSIGAFSALGVFTAMLCAIVATRLFCALYGVFAKNFRAYGSGGNSSSISAAAGILPFLICVTIFALFNLVLRTTVHANNLNDLIANAFTKLFSGIDNDLAGGIVYLLMVNLLWFFGIHGGNMMEHMNQLVFVPANATSDIISKTFLDSFALIGGSGATFCLLLALLIFAREKTNRRLSVSALPFAIFNINEFLVFGLPVIINPVMFIPFIITPIVMLIISYAATIVGFIPTITYDGLYWTTPALFSGYILTDSARGLIVQLVVVAVGTAIYAPFVKLLEKLNEKRESFVIDECAELVKKAELDGAIPALLIRSDNIGGVARAIALKLREDIFSGNTIPVFYQPQLNADRQMTGSEGLLRWKYKDKFIYPPMLVAISVEDGTFDELTKRIIETGLTDTRRLNTALCKVYKTSINIKPYQLSDTNFIKWVIERVGDADIGHGFCLEITEDSLLEDIVRVHENADILKQIDVTLSIDDFSMGSTSIKYLETGDFKFVKLDGSIVRGTAHNTRSREIIRAIVKLGVELDFEVVAEYVETEETRAILLELGVKYMQGWLHSKALPIEELIDFAKANS